MAIYEGSRYDGAFIHREDGPNGRLYLDVLPEEKFGELYDDDYVILFKEGMRLDLLAYEYYGDADLDWVILQANPQYITPLDIKNGDEINIPNPERVINHV